MPEFRPLSRQLATLLAACTWCITGAAQAQVNVQDPWIRAVVPQQTATGLFARITSSQAGRLVGGSSPAAGVVEIHEMKMDGSVMKMRAIAGLDLPAGQPVELKPGGYHLMLMDLKQGLKAGDKVPVTLVVELAGGQRQNVSLTAEVKAMAAAGKAEHGHHGHKH